MTPKEAILRIKTHNEIHRRKEHFAVKITEALQMAVEALEKQQWIPVTERLPQDMQERVLVTTDCDTPVGNQKIDTDRFRSGRWVRYGSHVTHWMPLPTPPKGDSV